VGGRAHRGDGLRVLAAPLAHRTYCRCTGFAGVESHRVTSTALVVDREDLTPELLVGIFVRNWIAGGWGEYLRLEPGTVVGRTGWCGGVEVRLAA